jgi:hypothetical protein
VHVRTLSLASFLELFLRCEGGGGDNDNDDEDEDEENGSSSDVSEDEDGENDGRAAGHGRRCSSRRRRAATNNPAQRWLASTALLAGPLLCFCKDMDRALPAPPPAPPKKKPPPRAPRPALPPQGPAARVAVLPPQPQRSEAA